MNILKTLIICLQVFICIKSIEAQSKEKPFKCGYWYKDEKQLNPIYYNYFSFFGCKKGEIIASVGAGGGVMEASIASYVDGISWTLQDIDTVCLNTREFRKILAYTVTLKNKPIKDSFTIVIGNEKSTNLINNNYDRILLINTYHELPHKVDILKDIYAKLKINGCLVVSDRFAEKKGIVRKDCGHEEPTELELLSTLETAGFILISKKDIPKKRHYSHECTIYTFAKK